MILVDLDAILVALSDAGIDRHAARPGYRRTGAGRPYHQYSDLGRAVHAPERFAPGASWRVYEGLVSSGGMSDFGELTQRRLHTFYGHLRREEYESAERMAGPLVVEMRRFRNDNAPLSLAAILRLLAAATALGGHLRLPRPRRRPPGSGRPGNAQVQGRGADHLRCWVLPAGDQKEPHGSLVCDRCGAPSIRRAARRNTSGRHGNAMPYKSIPICVRSADRQGRTEEERGVGIGRPCLVMESAGLNPSRPSRGRRGIGHDPPEVGGGGGGDRELDSRWRRPASVDGLRDRSARRARLRCGPALSTGTAVGAEASDSREISALGARDA